MISIDQINFFKQHGWVKIESGLSDLQINDLLGKTKKLLIQ